MLYYKSHDIKIILFSIKDKFFNFYIIGHDGEYKFMKQIYINLKTFKLQMQSLVWNVWISLYLLGIYKIYTEMILSAWSIVQRM